MACTRFLFFRRPRRGNRIRLGRQIYLYLHRFRRLPLLTQVRDWTPEDGESRQQTHYFHCDKIGIPREMTDKDGNLLWYGEYTAWGRLKEESKVTDSVYQPFRLQTSMPTVKPDCITTSSGITSLMRGGVTHWGYLFQQSFIWEKRGNILRSIITLSLIGAF